MKNDLYCRIEKETERKWTTLVHPHTFRNRFTFTHAQSLPFANPVQQIQFRNVCAHTNRIERDKLKCVKFSYLHTFFRWNLIKIRNKKQEREKKRENVSEVSEDIKVGKRANKRIRKYEKHWKTNYLLQIWVENEIQCCDRVFAVHVNLPAWHAQ